LIFTFFLRTAQVSGKSMLDTLQDQDRLMISRFFYTPRRGDIVVITKPNLDNEPLIKRIVATGGQTVDIDFEYGIVYVDGKALDEPYIKEPTNLKLDVQFPVTIPEGSIFVMGDNRNHSRDSRDSSIFTVDERYILGKVILRIMPFAGFGSVY
jgi:signal peptidase I